MLSSKLSHLEFKLFRVLSQLFLDHDVFFLDEGDLGIEICEFLL